MARIAVRGLGSRPLVASAVGPASVPVHPVDDPEEDRFARLLELVSAPLEDEPEPELPELPTPPELPLLDVPLLELVSAPADPLASEALYALREVHEKTLAAKASADLSSATRRAIDETHERTVDGIALVLSRVASAAQGARAGEANAELTTAAVGALREWADAAHQPHPAPHVEVTVPAPHVVVHPAEVRPHFTVEAPKAPGVTVNVPAQEPPVVHVAAPAVTVQVPQPGPSRAVAVRDERGELIAVEYVPVDAPEE